MLYDGARMALTKERLEDLRKEKKLSFEQLSKQLAERGVNISHTNLKNYEINDPVHPLYGRTRSMSIEYLVAFADFYDEFRIVSIDMDHLTYGDYDEIYETNKDNLIGIVMEKLKDNPEALSYAMKALLSTTDEFRK